MRNCCLLSWLWALANELTLGWSIFFFALYLLTKSRSVALIVVPNFWLLCNEVHTGQLLCIPAFVSRVVLLLISSPYPAEASFIFGRTTIQCALRFHQTGVVNTMVQSTLSFKIQVKMLVDGPRRINTLNCPSCHPSSQNLSVVKLVHYCISTNFRLTIPYNIDVQTSLYLIMMTVFHLVLLCRCYYPHSPDSKM